MTFPPAWESGSQVRLSRCVGLVFEPAMMLAWWKDSTFFQSHLSSLQSVGITTGPTDFFSQDPTLGQQANARISPRHNFSDHPLQDSQTGDPYGGVLK